MEFMLVTWYRNWNFSIDTVSILLVFGEYNFQFFGTVPYCKKSYEQKIGIHISNKKFLISIHMQQTLYGVFTAHLWFISIKFDE